MWLQDRFLRKSPCAAVASRHSARIALTHFLIFAAALSAQSMDLTLRVASEIVPAGGWAQIKVYADAPLQIGRGAFALDLDPRFFGPIESVSTFSATGDAIALLSGSDLHVDGSIQSPSGGIGQLPGVPVIVVRAPVRQDASDSGYVALSLPPGAQYVGPFAPSNYPTDAWRTPSGSPLRTVMVSTFFGKRGTLSVQDVVPNNGFQPSGTVLRFLGTGFSSSTKVSADGVGLSAVTFVSSTEIRATLATGQELTGLGFRVQNGTEEKMFFPAAPSKQVPLDPVPDYVSGSHMVIPLGLRSEYGMGPGSGGHTGYLVNPYTTPVDIVVTDGVFSSFPVSRTVSLPPLSTRFVNQGSPGTGTSMTASRPIRMTRLDVNSGGIQVPVDNPAPTIASITNGASQQRGSIAPGEIVTIRGFSLAAASSGVSLTTEKLISGIGPSGAKVLIGGIAAPILYASPTQWNVVVPNEVEGKDTVDVQLFPGTAAANGGGPSETWTLPVTLVAPAIFTSNSTGMGGAAVLNQNNTLNSPSNPATYGTTIQIFATGAGLFAGSVTGSVSAGAGNSKYPVMVRFHGADYPATYAGPAPGLTSGLIQVNAVIPYTTAESPLTIVVDGVESPSGVSVSVN